MPEYAFVIKNFSPISFKVKILHSTYGKINCVYPRDHQAKLLSTGSFISCNVEQVNNKYVFAHLDIIYAPITHDIATLEFIHQMMLICLRLLPNNIPVDDIFLFLIDIYKKNLVITVDAKKIILLRLFLLTEIFEHDVQLYKLAMQDPFFERLKDITRVERYLEIGFCKLYQQNKLEN